MDIRCPSCGETDDLRGYRHDDRIDVTCGSCGASWARDLSPHCDRCGSTALQAVHLAILEKSRGTQLSVVGTRVIDLCETCDSETLGRYYANLPNPLMPDEIPTFDSEEHR
ncbi:MAG: hypothetical protein HKN93_01855 [Acidimicrobiia bacterium]|nr:hypothetical protein [Acidimicrobiia bacterium]